MSVAASEAGNTPAALTTFVGRREDIAEVGRRLRSARLLTLTGVGGVGKTRLALEVADASRGAFPGGVWLVDLTTVSDPQAVPSATAAALGVADLGNLPLMRRLTAHLAKRKALLLLDNCEHLAEACAELAQTLLRTAPQLRVLATSRRSLDIIGEQLFTVPPLPTDEAAALLLERTRALDPGFQKNTADPEAVARLCNELDGLPLAIELAASRLRTLSVEQLADRLTDRFALLTGNSLAPRPQQRTLRTLIDWSYELCSAKERLLWNRVSVFTGSFSLEAAEHVCAGTGIPAQEVLDLLARLVAQSIVMPVEKGGTHRYALLETLRHYGRQRLTESGEEHALLQRHLTFFRDLAERLAAGWCGPGQEETLAGFRVEHSNLVAALRYGMTSEGMTGGRAGTEQLPPRDDGQRRNTQAALALAAALRFHWCFGGFLSEGRRLLSQLLAAAPDPTPARATALWVAGWVALLAGDHEQAGELLAEAQQLGEKHGDPLVCAHVEGLRGSLAMFQGRLPESAARFQAAVASFDSLGESPGTLFWLFQLAIVKALLQEADAGQIGRHGVAVAEKHGERLCRSYLLLALGFDAWTRGDTTAGSEFAQAALEIQRSYNDPIGTAMLLDVLTWLTVSRGEYERAARLLGAVDALWRRSTTTDTAFGPHMSGIHTRCTEDVLRILGQAAYDQAFAEGGRHDTPSRAIAFALAKDVGPEQSEAGPDRPLTRRELEIAALVAKGMSNRQIASALRRSPRTVDRHVENILAKLAFASRAQIAAWWTAHHGLAEVPPSFGRF